MARLIVSGPELVVAMSGLEKLGAVHGNIRVPLTAVRAVTPEPEPWSTLRGIRLAGTGIPGVVALGTRYFSGGKDFAALHGRGPAVVVELGDGSPYARLLVSVPDADSTAAEIRASAGI